jgi:enoyl-CoA hydratase/carnithine racemase
MNSPPGTVLVEKDGAIGRMIFNNPSRHNAVSKSMWHSMCEIVNGIQSDPNVRVLVVLGAGDKAFVSGADISEFEAVRATSEAVARYEEVSTRACLALEKVNKPTIAMINGYCIGGGFDIAMRCDLRFASETARFGIPAARLGVGYPFADIKRLVHHVGPLKAKEIFFTGRQFSAEEAMQMGFLSAVVPSAKLDQLVQETARVIADNAPLTIAAIKKCVEEALKDVGDRDLSACHTLVGACFASADYVEGRRAFMEKRKPRFLGH